MKIIVLLNIVIVKLNNLYVNQIIQMIFSKNIFQVLQSLVDMIMVFWMMLKWFQSKRITFHSSTQPSLHYPKDWLFYEEHNYPTKIYCLRVDIQGLLGMMSTWDLIKRPTNGRKLEQWKWQEVHIHLFFWTNVCIPVEELTHQIMKLLITKSWICTGG